MRFSMLALALLTAVSGCIRDEDGDGYGANVDCDDLDGASHPDADEVPYDGIDQDCDGADLLDVDGDGFLAEEVGGEDCDDADGEVHPDAPEVYYDGRNNDCNGETRDKDQDGDGAKIDEDCNDEDPTVDTEVDYFEDGDGDGYGAGLSEVVCGEAPSGFVANSLDCDDFNTDIRPGALEVCGDGTDHDCDGLDDPRDVNEPNDTFSQAPFVAGDDEEVFVEGSVADGDVVDVFAVDTSDDFEILINNFFVAAEIEAPPDTVALSLFLYLPDGTLASSDTDPSNGLYVIYGAPDISTGNGGTYHVEVVADQSSSCSDYTIRLNNGN